MVTGTGHNTPIGYQNGQCSTEFLVSHESPMSISITFVKTKSSIMYEYTAKLDRVVDGDTLDLIIDMGFKMTTNQRIRLAGINTPETYGQKHDSEEYKAGIKAKDFVVKRLSENENTVRIETSKLTGKYGRYIGVIWLTDNDISLNDELVQKGFAKEVHY